MQVTAKSNQKWEPTKSHHPHPNYPPCTPHPTPPHPTSLHSEDQILLLQIVKYNLCQYDDKFYSFGVMLLNWWLTVCENDWECIHEKGGHYVFL